MKKTLLTIIVIYLVSFSSYLFGDIYPAPADLTASKGAFQDTIKITWKAPVLPEFGEGFESGKVPPEGWTDSTRNDTTWQIMDNADYVHSGSYAAYVPFTYTEGEFQGFGSNRIKNGSFNRWTTMPGSVIISEMCDPKSNYRNNRFIEIYNSGEDTVDLTDWELVAIANNNEIHTWTLCGNIAPGQVLTCGDDSCTVNLDFGDTDWSDDNSDWDGKSGDGAKLKNANGIFIDIAVVSSTVFRDRYVYRRKGVCFGNTSYNSGEWIRSSSSQNIEDASPGTHTGALQKLSLPDYWQRTYVDLLVDTLAILDSILVINSDEESEYLHQDFSVSKYAKYKLSFRSKQDSLVHDSKYKIELYDNTNHKSLFVKDGLSNFEWEDYEFSIYTSSCDSIKIKLFPSDKGDSIKTYWDDIKFERYNYEPNQDEWLISSTYEVKSGDGLSFYLGISKTYGMNAPVYVLLYNYSEGDTSWDNADTLIVCDGADHDENYWEYKGYNLSLNLLSNVNVGDTIQIAFRYLGGNGDLVCLDDVSIGGQKRDLNEFFVIPIKNPKVKFGSRAPLSKGNKGSVLTGYKLYRRMYHDDRFYEITDTLDIIPDTTVIKDTVFIDTTVCMDTVYVYKAKTIYNNIIPSNYSNSDTGYVKDNSRPGTPYNLDYSANWTSGKITLSWHEPDSLSDDLKYYHINDDTLLYHLVGHDEAKLTIGKPGTPPPDYLIETKFYKFNIVAKDFAGNLSDTTEVCEILTPPSISVANKVADTPYGTLKITISKWASGEECSPSDSIRIYRSTSEDDTTFMLLKVLTDSLDFVEFVEQGDTIYKGVYTDTSVRTDSTYYYYATITYNDNENSRESLQSATKDATPQSNIANISNLRVAGTTDTSVFFQWTEPVTDSLSYGGVYIYKGENFIHPIDTVSVGDTTYTYIFTQPEITDFTFWAFDQYRVRWNKRLSDLESYGNILKNVVMGLLLQTSIEEFENDLPPTWQMEGSGTWQVSDDGSSQWFPIPSRDGKYAWINDDLIGQFDTTNCYLVLPVVTGLTDSDKVYLMFDSFMKNDYNGSSYISINIENTWNDAEEIVANTLLGKFIWGIKVIELTPYIASHIDSFQVAFHYDDNGTWSQGWAIDNVSLLSTSQLKTLLGKKFSPDTKFYLYANYPNPFRNFTNFSFLLAEPAKISLEIYNILGQRIATISNKEQFNKGYNNLFWDGTDKTGRKVATGIYLYKMSINDKSKVNKLMVIR